MEHTMATDTPPELVPLRADVPFWVEARPRKLDDESWVFDWVRVPSPGKRLAVQVKTLDLFAFEEVRALDDNDKRVATITERCLVAASHDGLPVPLASVPPMQRYAIAGAIFQLSASGLDPFGERPAVSPP
jgi:hypothetical protein